jgi:hypothetical protein
VIAASDVGDGTVKFRCYDACHEHEHSIRVSTAFGAEDVREIWDYFAERHQHDGDGAQLSLFGGA